MKEWLMKDGNYNCLYVGFSPKGDEMLTTTGDETRKQINALCKLPITLNNVTWKKLYNPKESRSLLKYIEADRYEREKSLMADRPPFFVAWIHPEKNQVDRIEFYQGHDFLEKIHDVQSLEYDYKKEEEIEE